VNGVVVACLYLPNGNPYPGPKFDYKLHWFDRLASHATELLATTAPVVLAGDFNVMPRDLDVYKPERWVDDALFRPEVRDDFIDSSRRAGPMPFARFTRMSASILSGITSETPGPEMRVCGSTICWSVHPSLTVSPAPRSTVRCAVGKRRAIMRRPGSNSQTIVTKQLCAVRREPVVPDVDPLDPA
jgi:hypothetical protein